jgi:uncharacterized membrane protein
LGKRWLGILFVAATVVFVVTVYGSLPERVATHYDINGKADGWSGRLAAAWLLPAMAVLMLVMFSMLPRISPRFENFKKFEETYWVVANGVVGFLCVMHVLLLGRALNWPIDVSSSMLLGMGVMFMVIGNVMPRMRSNWWMGIRTPWTMENEEVWRETHRLGGRTFLIGGAVTIVAALLPVSVRMYVAMAALVVAGFVPVVYSYFVWRRLKRSS